MFFNFSFSFLFFGRYKQKYTELQEKYEEYKDTQEEEKEKNRIILEKKQQEIVRFIPLFSINYY